MQNEFPPLSSHALLTKNVSQKTELIETFQWMPTLPAANQDFFENTHPQ